uniref:Uncharacterized protein n=1 Tax=Phlebotomus papatasi TaxID=29031 RepID=A0A1B0CYK0_PHLPP
MTVSVTHGQTTTTTTHPHPTTAAMARPTSPGNSSGSETDQVSGTALRRLYFKSGRHARARGPAVPKVVVMGSSTTSNSEATINTSTESASTLMTNVTATDTETCDSLDLGDTSGLMEPLLSSLDEAPTTAINIPTPPLTNGCPQAEIDKESQKADEAAPEVGNRITSPAPDPPLLLNYEEDPSNQPKTAPVTSQSRFPFDRPPSPRSVRTLEKNQPLFTFEEGSERRESRHKDQNEDEKKCEKPVNGRVALKDKYILSKRMSAKKRFGQTDSTMFPFDREALDYERIQRECFALEEETKFPFDSDTGLGYDSPDSPMRESIKRSDIELKDRRMYEGPQDVFQQYTLLAQQESMMQYVESTPKPSRRSTKRVNKGNYTGKYDAFSPKNDHSGMSKFDQITTKFDQMAPKGDSSPSGGAHGTSTPLPDLRVDFFAEEPSSARGDDANLEECQKIMQRGDAINVTSNPLDAAVCTQPRATIVVQQVRVSIL